MLFSSLVVPDHRHRFEFIDATRRRSRLKEAFLAYLGRHAVSEN